MQQADVPDARFFLDKIRFCAKFIEDLKITKEEDEMTTERKPKPLFKQGDVVFTTRNRKKLKLIAKYTFGWIDKIRWSKSGYQYYVFFEPTRIRPLVCIYKTDVWLNEADLLLKSEYAKYYLQKKINRFEADIERLRLRIQGDKNQLLESKKEVEHLKTKLQKLIPKEERKDGKAG